jgi:hypothetical protein
LTKIENHCCSCATPGYPCLGNACSLINVELHYCDKCDPKCESPLDEIYDVDGEELCEECLKEKFRRKD